MDCVFCKIVAGEIPCTRVYEDDEVLAILDIQPVAPVHVLVMPKAHITGAGAITAADGDIVARIFAAMPGIAAAQGVTDFRVVTNSGESAGQSVGHLHFHLLGGRRLGEMG